MSAQEVLGQASEILDKMDHLSPKQKEKSLAELILYGKSMTSGLSIIKE
jgi:hypothetical protein